MRSARWSNYHTHCHLCDGVGAPREYAEAALQQRMRALGFSSHAPVAFATDWTMPLSRLDTYLDETRSLREAYCDRLAIYVGLETDFILDGPVSPVPPDRLASLDYTIGAVHFLAAPDSAVPPFTVDGPAEELEAGIRRVFGSDTRAAVERYFESVRAMLRARPCPVVAHLDLVKKNNEGDRFFSEDAPWYRDAARETVEVIAAAGASVEVNTGGLSRGRVDALYPSDWILEQCLALGVPVTLSSDAHEPSGVIALFCETACRLRDLGFRETLVLDAAGWRPEPIPC